MDVEFNSLQELYERIKPALSSKKEEMHKLGYSYIEESDIWNYLKEIKWKQSQNLSLCDIVSDIFNTDSYLIDNYLKKKLNSQNRRLYFD